MAVMFNSTALIAQELEVTLTLGSYNGFNISCFGARDGNIDATVTGGTPPYTYIWTNGATTQDLNNVAAGYYKIIVRDALSGLVEVEITLTEPEPMGADFMLSSYPNGYNISCYNCFNGHILLYANGGVGPYTYTWEDGPTTTDRFNLGRGSYSVNITDANQCVLTPELFQMTEPDRSDWTQFGNTGSDPNLHFIGTIDNKDIKIKTNNTERLEIKANGEIKLNGLPPGMIHLDQNNIIRSSNEALSTLCVDAIFTNPHWSALGSSLLFSCPVYNVSIGSFSIPNNVKFKVEGNSFLNGSVFIGIDPNLALGGSTYKLLVDGKLGAKEIYCSLGNPWPDYVFENDYELLSLTTLRNYVSTNKHLPGVPSAAELESKGANMMELMSKAYEKIEELHLYIFDLEERLRKMEAGE
jgi:SprB repeat